MVWFLRLLLFRRPYVACLLKLRLVLPTWSVAYDPPSIFLFIYGMLVTLCLAPPTWGVVSDTLSLFPPIYGMVSEAPFLSSPIYGMLA